MTCCARNLYFEMQTSFSAFLQNIFLTDFFNMKMHAEIQFMQCILQLFNTIIHSQDFIVRQKSTIEAKFIKTVLKTQMF